MSRTRILWSISLTIIAMFSLSAQVAAEEPASGPSPDAILPEEPAPVAAPSRAFKGLYESLKERPVRWLPEPFITDEPEAPLSQLLVTPPTKKKYVDPYFEPVLLLRMNYVTTRESQYIDKAGKTRRSMDLRRTYLGHREGFVLENAELGFKGRVNQVGLYYSAKLELVPREKDGTRSESDYLKEIYAGWNYYRVFDIRLGRIKMPFSQANNTSTHDMPLVYAPLLDTLLPKRLLGVSCAISDPWGIGKISGGVFNTIKEPYEQMPDAKHLQYAGRAEVRIDRIFDVAGVRTGSFFNMSLGGGIAYAKESYDPRTEMRYLGVDARVDVYIFSIVGELVLKDYYDEETKVNQDGVKYYPAKRGVGWHVDVTAHAWPTVLDLTFRYEEADNDNRMKVDFASEVALAMGQKKRWLTYGMMLHLARQVDLEFNYINRREAEGKNLSNDVFMTLVQFSL